jgi:hypothetical protein
MFTSSNNSCVNLIVSLIAILMIDAILLSIRIHTGYLLCCVVDTGNQIPHEIGDQPEYE